MIYIFISSHDLYLLQHTRPINPVVASGSLPQKLDVQFSLSALTQKELHPFNENMLPDSNPGLDPRRHHRSLPCPIEKLTFFFNRMKRLLFAAWSRTSLSHPGSFRSTREFQPQRRTWNLSTCSSPSPKGKLLSNLQLKRKKWYL